MAFYREVERIEDLAEAAHWLLESWPGRILAVEGEMGVGKTTFIKVLCKTLGVTDRVSSPTYSLVNEYFSTTEGPVYHFDFYRLEDPSEALDMGLEDYLDSGHYCFMEWPEKVENLLPDDCDRLKITVNNGIRIFELNTAEV